MKGNIAWLHGAVISMQAMLFCLIYLQELDLGEN